MNNQRTSAFLMANLGAEVSRIISAKEKSDNTYIRECFERAQKILKEIVAMPDMRTRAGEIKILSNVILDMINPHPTMPISSKNIKSYFVPFAERITMSS